MRASSIYLHLPVFLVASFISCSLTFLDKNAFSYHFFFFFLISAASFLSLLLRFPPDVHTTEEVSENQAVDEELNH